MIASGTSGSFSNSTALLVGLFLLAVPSFGQDLLVINKKDSMNCKVRASDAKGIFYDYLYKDEIQKAYILKNDVVYLQKNFYDERFTGDRRRRDLRSQSLRFSLQGGIGWLPGRIDERDPDWFQDHQRALQVGVLQRADLHFMILQNWGLGATLGSLRTRHITHDIEYYSLDGTVATGAMQDDIRLLSYGVSSFYQQQVFHPKVYVLAIASFEQVQYRNNAILMEPLELRGKSYGGRLGMALEYRWKYGLGVGLSAHHVIVNFETITVTNDPLGRNLITNTLAMGGMRRWDLGLAFSLSY